MVTHDPRYAEFADRIIRLFDGHIVENEVAAPRTVVVQEVVLRQAEVA
jgi:ABC-type lipoprotein export system ATPase subunit